MAQFNTTDSGIMVKQSICLKFPPKINSPGLFEFMVNNARNDQILDYIGTTFHLQMTVIFALTQSFHFIFRLLGMPMLISQIATGIILGQTILGNEMLLGDHGKIAFSKDSIQVLGTISAFGYMFFLFLTTVKMDLNLIKKAGKKALCIGLLCVLAPLLSGILTSITLSSKGESLNVKNKNMFLTILYSISSFPVVHCLLVDLKILNSELGRLSLSVALIGDNLSVILMNIGYLISISFESSAGNNKMVGLIDFGLIMCFVLIVIFVFRPAMQWMVRQTPEGAPVRSIFLYAIIVLFLLSPKLGSWFHLFILFTPLIGLAVPDGPPLGSALVEKFEFVVNGLFLPLFVTACAMRVDLTKLNFSNPSLKNQALINFVITMVKFGVTLGLPFFCDVPKRDSLALAFIMNTKGIVELGALSFLNDNQFISDDLFAFLFLIVAIMAAIPPILVKFIYDPSRKYVGYQERNIMRCKFNEELRLLACIHIPSNVTNIINLLNSSCPTSDSPLTVDVLHLVKLTGRATPLFISHKKHRNTTIFNKSYSENVVLAFNQFERDNWEAVEVNVFTAISPPTLMQEDICNLAMDKHTSFIILPFHRRWSIDGSRIESDDQAVRSLNCNIMKTAPCSVGILVEGRRHLRRTNSKDSAGSLSVYSIAVIFLGGKDDREALTLAKRFSQDARVSLTVIHLKAQGNLASVLASVDTMLNEAVLEDVKDNEYVSYIEKEVRDGPETSLFLRSMVNEHHLIIVGRQCDVENPQTEGLKEWSEFQELGLTGDLLASTDFTGAYSLLVVQQQQQKIR
ncbi:hypothetical protein SLA2020_231740 [Shorea laevis]